MNLRLGTLRRWVGAAVFLFAALFVSVASAATGTIALVVHGDDLPRERLRDAIAHELGRPVILVDAPDPYTSDGGALTVTYRRAARELAVTWDGPKRGTVSRVIAARPRVEDVTADAAMLAGNLARDEVEELVPPPPADPAPVTPLMPLPAATGEPTPAPIAPTRDTAKAAGDPDFEGANFGLLYPAAVNRTRPWLRTRFDLNILSGRVGQVDGVQIGGVNVIAKANGRGTGDLSGLQLAYAMNVACGNVAGLQIGLVGNIACGDEVRGWQVGWIGNLASGTVMGAQTAMFVNRAGALEGGQISLLNIGGDVKGFQLGLVNVARKVDGAMLGVINVADDVDGVPFGVASVTKTGGVHPTAWGSTGAFGNFGIKLATKHTYTMPSGHVHHAYGKDFYGAGFTLGGRIGIDHARYVDTDLGLAWLYAPERTRLPDHPDTYHEHLVQPRLRVLFGWRFADHFGLFAGLGVLTQIRLEQDGNKVTGRVGPEAFFGVEL